VAAGDDKVGSDRRGETSRFANGSAPSGQAVTHSLDGVSQRDRPPPTYERLGPTDGPGPVHRVVEGHRPTDPARPPAALANAPRRLGQADGPATTSPSRPASNRPPPGIVPPARADSGESDGVPSVGIVPRRRNLQTNPRNRSIRTKKRPPTRRVAPGAQFASVWNGRAEPEAESDFPWPGAEAGRLAAGVSPQSGGDPSYPPG